MNKLERIRELAYQIWESEGKPDGQEHRHWEMASQLVSFHGDADAEKDAEEHCI